jgi:ligand-binding sensor domain-containing protein
MIENVRRLILSLLIVLYCSTTFVVASPISPYFDRLTITQGLSQNNVYTTLRDSQGFLWFGTLDGLNRYDGYDFKIFRHESRTNHSISDNYINVLFEDSHGIIWVGTRGGGLNSFNITQTTPTV